ncbi:MAG: hypothetical protein JSR41_11465 [Proteobacteria bacterium]|nr:hypothetical protein [Pseudomonadota bacterium]
MKCLLRFLAGLCGLAGALAVHAAQMPVLASILDGEAVLLRESGRFAVAEGVRFDGGDIVETGAQARLLRLEFADGTIIDLGPATRALVAPRLAGKGAAAQAPHLHVLQGWFKLITPASGKGTSAATVLTPAYALSEAAGQQVVSSEPAGLQLFCEAGAATLQERITKAPAPIRLKAGEYFSRLGSDKAAVKPRPAPAFIQAVPRSFLDPLPSRAALFKEREVLPKRTGDLAYEDVAAWLSAEPALRSQFAARWRALARRPDFRAGLVTHMRSHPEWDRIVFPEKYLPKRPPAVPAAPRPATSTY